MPRTVDAQPRVSNDLLNHTLILKIRKRFPGQRSVDFETVDESGDGDEAVGLDFLVELIGRLLVEDDGVVGLVLDCLMR